MEPWVSIVVPVYNVENYLEKCVESLVNQTFSDWEIILVDDGSTDKSGIICDEISQKYSNIFVVHKSNAGLSSARNAGIQLAKGKYIAFVDSDDWMELDAYRILFEKCGGKDPDIINYGYQKVCNGNTLYQEKAVFPEAYYGFGDIQNWILPESIAREKAFNQIHLPVQLSACMCIYKRDFLKKYDLIFESEREVSSEDWLFNIRCLCRAENILITHDILYNYYTRANSISMTYRSGVYEGRKVMYERYREALAEIGREDLQMQQRLRNFWMEAIYCCYIIELNAPSWDKRTRDKIKYICKDPEFLAYSRNLTLQNCTIKGLVFLLVIKLRLHGMMRFVYKIKRRLEKAS